MVEAFEDMAKVRTSRHSDCENCGACPGNSALVLEARNPLNAQKGQLVIVEVKDANMLKAAFVVYILPLIAVAAGAVAGAYLAASQQAFNPLWHQLGGGTLFFVLSIIYIKYFDSNARNNHNMQPVITRILS